MLRRTSTDKENFSLQVTALATPARRPLACVQDSCLSVTPATSLKKKFGIFSPSIVQKKKRKSKRFSVPAYKDYQFSLDSLSEFPSSDKDATVKENVSAVKDDESLHGKDVTEFVQKVVKGIVNEIKVQANDTEAAKKMEGYENIILQMNKERLQMEKQLNDTLKMSWLPAINIANKDDNKDKKGKYIQLELDEKTKEVQCLKQQLSQVQELVLEIPTLKNDLHQSKQETKNLSVIVFSCRKENTNQKEVIAKLHKELEEHEAAFRLKHETLVGKLTSELEQRESECLQLAQVISQHEEEAEGNQGQCQVLSVTVDRLENLASMAEAYKKMAEDRVRTLQQQVEELTESQQTNLNTLDEWERELHKMRSHAQQEKEKNLALEEKMISLEADKDIGRLEILRQQGVIRQQEQEMKNLRMTVCQCQDQMEILQTQQQEMNDFVEEERRNLEETAHEMERQLKISTAEKSQIDVSLKERSLKCVVLTEDVLQSRSLLHEKQEELDATQSQAHWVLLQQEAEMTEAASQLGEAWKLVNSMLDTFSKQAGLQMDPEKLHDVSDKHTTSASETSEEHSSDVFTPVSLVQCVLAATARRNEGIKTPSQIELGDLTEECVTNDSNTSIVDMDSMLTISDQACGLKRALEQLREIGSGEAANHKAEETIQRLTEERNSAEERYKSNLNRTRAELDESRASEAKFEKELKRKCSEITLLHGELKESRDNLRLAFVKLDALSEECSRQIEKEADTKELGADLKNAHEDLKKLKEEKELMSVQLQEALSKMDDLSKAIELPDEQNTDRMLGELMAEKLSLEKKLKQVKEKSLSQRLQNEDCLAEYKCRAEAKIKVLESNIQKAECEIYRLDDILERIRVVLQENSQIASESPELQQLLDFLNGAT